MRTLSADWMANTGRPESDLQPLQHGGEESKGNFFYPRPVAPTAAQVPVHYICLCALCVTDPLFSTPVITTASSILYFWVCSFLKSPRFVHGIT